MNLYEEGLHEVIEYLIEKSDGCLEDDLVGVAFQNVLKQYIYDVAVSTSDLSDHGGRASISIFDLETAFSDMDIELEDLMKLWEEEKNRKEPAIQISSKKTLDQDYHVGPVPSMGTVVEKHDPHIPDYMPGFPCVHTYQKTWIYDETEQDRGDLRNRVADKNLCIQNALNNYLVNSRPTVSLFLTPQTTNRYDLLLVEPSDKQRPAYLKALLSPRDSCNLHPIVNYDDDEDESSNDDDDTDEDVPMSLFIAKPQLESKCPRKAIPDEDFQYIETEPIVETTWQSKQKPSPKASESDVTDNDESEHVDVLSDVEYWSASE